jgi:uncharacterized protein (TIGR03032 family)
MTVLEADDTSIATAPVVGDEAGTGSVAPSGADGGVPGGGPDDTDVRYSFSSGLIDRLARLDIALAFTSYQSGLLYMLGSDPERGAQLHQSAVPKPMGLAVDPRGGLVLAAGTSIIRYTDVLAAGERINGVFDACYMPRATMLTGELDAHDIGIDDAGRPIFANTRFNCLATTSATHSFEPVWRPPFVSALIDEDRCHLNGLAMHDGRPAYVTAASRSDTIDGWRDRRASGGVAIDVASGAIVCSGLSMPHSPRVHRGALWLLNSGTGELGTVSGGRFVPRAFAPGFVRGLAFHDNLAFVGLSRPRYPRFGGLVLDDRLAETDSEPWCGIQAIDIDTGACVDWFRIDGAVAELFDVAVIPGKRCPMAVSPGSGDAANLITFDRRRSADASA